MAIKLFTSEDDSNLDKLLHLNPGDKLYNIEVEHDGDKEVTNVVIHTLEFKHYEGDEEGKKIESIPKYEIGNPIMATLIDPKYPTIDIKHQDLSIGFFFDPIEAINASIELFEMLIKALKEKKMELENNG